MKKNIFLYHLIISLFLSMTAVNGIAETILKVGVEGTYPPMVFRNNEAEIVGFEADLLREIGKRIGVTIKFIIVDWDKITEALNSKKIDLIASGLSITEERKNLYAYTVAVIKNRQAIAVNLTSPIQYKHDLGGKTVCMESGSYAIPLVEQYKGKSGEDVKLIQSDGADACLRELISGNVDAAVLDHLVVSYYTHHNKKLFRILHDHFGEDEIAFGLRLEETEQLQRINKTIENMQQDGTMKSIRERWFGSHE